MLRVAEMAPKCLLRLLAKKTENKKKMALVWPKDGNEEKSRSKGK